MFVKLAYIMIIYFSIILGEIQFWICMRTLCAEFLRWFLSFMIALVNFVNPYYSLWILLYRPACMVCNFLEETPSTVQHHSTIRWSLRFKNGFSKATGNWGRKMSTFGAWRRQDKKSPKEKHMLHQWRDSTFGNYRQLH